MDFYITCNYLHLGCWLHSQELFSQCLKPTFGFVFWPWDICLLAISHCCFYSVLARLVRRVGRGVSFLRFWWSICPRQTLCPGLKNNSHSEVCPAVGGGRPLTSFPAPLPHGTKSTHIPLFWPVFPCPSSTAPVGFYQCPKASAQWERGMMTHAVFLQWLLFPFPSHPHAPQGLTILPHLPCDFLVGFVEENVYNRTPPALYVIPRDFVLAFSLTPNL